jgi:hypothetical protein
MPSHQSEVVTLEQDVEQDAEMREPVAVSTVIGIKGRCWCSFYVNSHQPVQTFPKWHHKQLLKTSETQADQYLNVPNR